MTTERLIAKLATARARHAANPTTTTAWHVGNIERAIRARTLSEVPDARSKP